MSEGTNGRFLTHIQWQATRPIKQLAVIRAQQLGFDVGSGRGEHPQRGRRAESVTEMWETTDGLRWHFLWGSAVFALAIAAAKEQSSVLRDNKVVHM